MLPKFLQELDPQVYWSDNYVVLDFEVDTSHGDYGNPIHHDNQLLLGCYRLGAGHPDFHNQPGTTAVWGDEFSQGQLLAVIEKAQFIVAHRAKYELGWLRRCGADLRQLLPFDTELGEYVLMGNLAAGGDGIRPRSISLDNCCIRRGWRQKDPVVDTLIHHSINPVRIPRVWLQMRCEQDVETTEQLFLSQRAQLTRMGLLQVLFTRCLLTPVLADIEPEGMALDPEVVESTYTEYVAKLGELEQQMKEMTGGINWRSRLQMAEFIYDKLGFEELKDWKGKPKRTPPTARYPQGQRKTDNKTLDKLKAVTEEQQRFLKLRKEIGRVGAALSKNLEFFVGVCRERGGVFFAELNQTTTATHRLSSTGIRLVFETLKDLKGKPKSGTAQFQNLPRSFKKLFRAKREGWLIAEPDGSQLEFRVAAELGGPDQQALRDIENPDFDAHAFTASVLFNVPVDQVTTDGAHSQRQLAKPDTFKPLYGGTKGTERQEQYYAAFRERYRGVHATQERWVNQVLLKGVLVTPWGLRYYWPNARKSSSGYVNVGSAIYNYPIQALATAEIIPIALVYLWHRIREEGLEDSVRIINTVHDSAPCEVHPEAIPAFVSVVKRCFTDDVYAYLERVYGMDFRVPLGCGIKIGTHWGSGEEVQFNVWKTGKQQRKVGKRWEAYTDDMAPWPYGNAA